VLIVRPRTLRDVQDAVARHGAVKASGAGHSWNREFFCADAGADANTTTAANIAMTTLRPRAIDVDEAGGAVWVDAAVILADLLAYLAAYVTPSAPAGWTLAAPPWFVYQTVGGAVATGTHGSNLE
jgi:FAD/FMN-containing dehydrogenase